MSGASAPPPAEQPRRNLAILFADLSGSTRIGASMDPEEYRELLAAVRAIYREVIATHGGVIAQFMGDGMLALFGYPEPGEDDGRRAVEAALDLHDQVHRLGDEMRWGGTPLRLHSGIHAGLVLLIEGDQISGRFEIVGEATNIASRLCALAGEGQILVSEATLGPERHLFHTSERTHLELRGKVLPVAVLEVLGRASARSRFAASVRGGLTPFVGREAELARLKAALDEAIAGAVRFTEIEGPAGVGKTRLAEEVLRQAGERGAQVHRGECDSTAEPLQPFLQIARSVLGLGSAISRKQAAKLAATVLTDIDPALAPHFPVLLAALSLDRGGETAGAGAIAALLALLTAAAQQSPLILFIDDWHVADDASRDLLAQLRAVEDRPVFILATARPSPPGADLIGPEALLRLTPLGPNEIAEAVASLLPSANPFTLASIREQSGGNPLYIEELCHSLASRRESAHPDPGSAWLDTLIESRFTRLPEAQAELVRAAAVIGTVIPAWLFALITGREEDDPLVAALADQDFVFPGEREGTLRFKHGITREAVYNCIGLRTRKALHMRIAKALRERSAATGEEEPHEALAYHYGAAGEHASTAHHAELAGDRALAASALDRAQAQYRAALTALERLPPSDDVSFRWGRIAQRFGRAGVFDPSRDQLPVFDRAIELALLRRDEAAVAWAQYWLGYIYYGLGEPDSAIRHWRQALAAADAVSDQRLVVETRMALGQGHAAACDYRQALPLLDEAIDNKRAYRTPGRPPITLAYSLSCKAFALGDMGQFDEAYARFDEAIEAIAGARHEGEVSVLNQYAVVRLWHGQAEEAVRLAEEGARVAERVHSHYSHAMSRSIIAFADWTIAPSARAAETLVEATAWLEASGRGQFTSLNHGWLARVMVASGRIEEGRKYAARALDRARKRDRLGVAMALRAMARASAASGWHRPPGHYLELALAAARARASPHEEAAIRLCEAELALAAGAQARAEAALGEAITTFAALGMERHLQRVQALARTPRPDR